MGHYTRRNLSKGGRALTVGVFALMAQLSETFVFIYMGASVFLASSEYYGTAALVVVMCLASRAAAIYPGVSLINWNVTRNANSSGSGSTGAGANIVSLGGMSESYAHMLWFSGLRGAMAFALALEAAAKRGADGRAMLTGTLATVLFTTLGVGGFIVSALKRLGIQCGNVGGGGGEGSGGDDGVAYSYESIIQMGDSAASESRSNEGKGKGKGHPSNGKGEGGTRGTGAGASKDDDDAKILVSASSDLSEGDTRERAKTATATARGRSSASATDGSRGGSSPTNSSSAGNDGSSSGGGSGSGVSTGVKP